MPLPELTVTWRHRVNISCTEDTDLEHRQRLLFEIVRSILGLGSGWTDGSGTAIASMSSPWEVHSSSDSVADDATNRWEDITDLVWAAEGVAHSWIVLVHQDYFGTDVPLYMLINCSQGGAHRNATLGVYLSRNVFGENEGGVTDRPTATEEIEVLPSDGSMATAPWQGVDTNDEDHRVGRLHCWLSDDGRCFRAIICRNGVDVAYWDLFGDANYDVDTWSVPAIMTVASLDSDESFLIWDNLQNVGWFKTRDDVTVAAAFSLDPTMTIYGSVTPITELPAISCGGESGWDSIKLAARTPGAGLFSAIPDMWWGRSAEVDATFGDDGTFQQFTNIVVPWNGSTVQKT